MLFSFSETVSWALELDTYFVVETFLKYLGFGVFFLIDDVPGFFLSFGCGKVVNWLGVERVLSALLAVLLASGVMGIVRNNFKGSKMDTDLWLGGRGGFSSDEDELQTRASGLELEPCSVSDSDVDSGAASDDSDLSELGETGAELCQLGTESFFVPFDLYDLPDLRDVLSLETWNNDLTEDERFSLAEFLPDMDQETFMRTLKELFSGASFHFCSPLAELFERLKGGLCEPRIALYQQGLKFLEKRKHYHLLRKYHSSMVSCLIQIKDALDDSHGYGTEDRVRVLNGLRSQKLLICDKRESVHSLTDSSEKEEQGDGFWSKKLKDVNLKTKTGDRRTATVKSSLKREPGGYEKPNPKGVLKVAKPTAPGKNLIPANHGLSKLKPRQCSSHLGQAAGYAHRSSQQSWGHFTGDDDSEGQGYEMSFVRKQKNDKVNFPVQSKKHGYSKEDPPNYVEYTYSVNESSRDRNKNSKQTVDLGTATRKAPKGRSSFDHHSSADSKNVKHQEKIQRYMADSMGSPAKLKGAHADRSTGNQSYWHSKPPEEPLCLGNSTGGHSAKKKKWKVEEEYKISNNSMGLDCKSRGYKTGSSPNHGLYSPLDPKVTKSVKGAQKYLQNGVSMEKFGIRSSVEQNEETESDSSDEVNENVDFNYIIRKMGYQKDVRSTSKRGLDLGQMHAHGREIKKESEQAPVSEIEIYTSLGKQKLKTNESILYNDDLKEDYAAFSKLGDGHRLNKSRKKGPLHGSPGEMSCLPLKTSPIEKKRKPKTGSDSFLPYMDYRKEAELAETGGFIKKLQSLESHKAEPEYHESLDRPFLGSHTKKQKGRADAIYLASPEHLDHPHWNTQPSEDPKFSKRKGKKKMEAETGPMPIVTSDTPVPDGAGDVEPDGKSSKKQFPLITPTLHTGFSFSIVHLLSAVRMAMITPPVSEDSGVAPSGEKLDVNVALTEQSTHNNLPALSVQEIVNRVRSDPGDPCILETQEPLQDLVRGVLKIFSSKTAPLGAKGWKALVIYEKAKKSWSWVGPLISCLLENDPTDEETTSAASWGVPHKMLVKLVDAFANWLKSGQQTLQQIGSLPAPPMELLSHIDEKERFKDLRAQKSLNTFGPSSEEVRTYFRKEEVLRYLVPDRAFSYTAADGRKSIVAPLRRCGGKPTSKARDHFMLKPDRPPHVTILCLVRDAAARLPSSIGTRADVCTLIRDSQYIVDDVSDAQVNQVVSGALDRLHYERDPCVQFDAERKLWVYLHRDREEEDFEDDGTSSTKKWKRQRKDPTDNTDSMQGHDSCAGDQVAGGCGNEYDFGAEYNVGSSSVYEQEGVSYTDVRPNIEITMDPLVDAVDGGMHRGHPMGWEVLELNQFPEKKMFCQENSMNEAFDDEGFGREGPVRIVTAGLM